MIVRIMGEGQFRVDGGVADRLNEVDNRLVQIVSNNDQEGFHKTFRELLDSIRQHCTPVPAEEIVESDIVLPPDDTTFEEAKDLFQGEGILPG